MPDPRVRRNPGRAYVLLALILPWLAIAGSIAKATLEGGTGRVHTLEIGGFDPRDLLRGHYLQYRLLAADEPAVARCAREEGCRVCLRRDGDGTRVEVEGPGVTCADPVPAEVFAGRHRYLLSEALARPAERLLAEAAADRRATVDLRVLPGGALRAEAIRIDGEPIEALAERLPREAP